MSTAEVPLSFQKKMEFEKNIANIKKKQEEEYQKRVKANFEHEKITSEKLLKEFKDHMNEESKKLSNPNGFYVPAENNFFVVIQIRSQIHISPKQKKTLELLRLSKVNSCVIVRNNESIKKMLEVVKDYVAFGWCNYETLRKLIYQRGFGKIHHSKVKLTNEAIETAFNGKYKCIEELVNVIYFGKEDITRVCNFLYTFGLQPPTKGFSKEIKKRDFIQGGAANNHMELLGELLEKMI